MRRWRLPAVRCAKVLPTVKYCYTVLGEAQCASQKWLNKVLVLAQTRSVSKHNRMLPKLLPNLPSVLPLPSNFAKPSSNSLNLLRSSPSINPSNDAVELGFEGLMGVKNTDACMDDRHSENTMPPCSCLAASACACSYKSHP
jgi:hypothetical protein